MTAASRVRTRISMGRVDSTRSETLTPARTVDPKPVFPVAIRPAASSPTLRPAVISLTTPHLAGGTPSGEDRSGLLSPGGRGDPSGRSFSPMESLILSRMAFRRRIAMRRSRSSGSNASCHARRSSWLRTLWDTPAREDWGSRRRWFFMSEKYARRARSARENRECCAGGRSRLVAPGVQASEH
jgi:hypothetical protein